MNVNGILEQHGIYPTYSINLLSAHKKPNQKRLLTEVSLVITDGNHSLVDYSHTKFILVFNNVGVRMAKIPHKYTILHSEDQYNIYKHDEYNIVEFVNSSKACDLWFRYIGKDAGAFSLPKSPAHAQGYYYIVVSNQDMIKKLVGKRMRKQYNDKLIKAVSKEDMLEFVCKLVFGPRTEN